MWKFKLVGPTNKPAKILSEGDQLVSIYPCPPLLPQKNIIFTQYLTDDGTPSGSNDLGIDGSATSVDFYICSCGANDLYIATLNLIVGYGTSGQLWEFADANVALTNGVEIKYIDSRSNEVIIDNIKKNSDLLGVCLIDSIIPTAWELRHLGAANDYGYLCSIDLKGIMPPFGIKLDRGSNQRLSITIRDDCTDADTFNCRARGFERFE